MNRLAIDKDYYELMNRGFEKKYLSFIEDVSYENENISPNLITKAAARLTSDQLELRKTKDEQLKELKRKRMMERSGFMKLIPQNLHKYIDYLVSLRKDPGAGELTRNLGLGVIFSFIIFNNARARMAFMYTLIGNLAVLSILLTRNMPKLDVPMGMDKNRVVNYKLYLKNKINKF